VNEGADVAFTFAEYGEPLIRTRVGVDAALLQADFAEPAQRAGDDPVIVYERVEGYRVKFSRVPPKRQGAPPAWRFETVVATPAPTAPTPATVKPEGKAPPPVADAKRAEPLTSFTQRDVDAGRVVVGNPPTPEEKRDVVRAAYVRELRFVIKDVLPIIKKAKIKDFDVNAAVATLCIAQDRRGCL
jgi:hypothetical protein